MKALFSCDHCAYEEWRERLDEPQLCPVCGNARWSVLEDPESDLDMTEPTAAGDTEGGRV